MLIGSQKLRTGTPVWVGLYEGNNSESCGRVCPKEGEEDGRQTLVDEAKHFTNHSEEAKDVETLPRNT